MQSAWAHSSRAKVHCLKIFFFQCKTGLFCRFCFLRDTAQFLWAKQIYTYIYQISPTNARAMAIGPTCSFLQGGIWISATTSKNLNDNSLDGIPEDVWKLHTLWQVLQLGMVWATFSVLFGRHESIIGRTAIFFAVHSSTGTFQIFSCGLLIPVIKFCIIIICMMLMTVIGVVPLYWLNWSLYATGCQTSVFLMVACLHTTTCDLISHFVLS